VKVCACCIVRTTCCPLAPSTRTCIIVKQNYILPFLNKPALTSFLSPYRFAFESYLFSCQVTTLLRGSSKRPDCTFRDIKADLHSRLLGCAEVQRGIRNLRSAACRDDVNFGTGGDDPQCLLLTL